MCRIKDFFLIAVNHVLKKFNVRQELLEVGQKSAKVGNAEKPKPALQKQDALKKGKAKALPAPARCGKGADQDPAVNRSRYLVPVLITSRCRYM